MRIAALDLGSNSLKITVASIDPGGALEVIGEDAIITRIGQDLDKTNRLSDEAIARTISGLERLVAFALANGAAEIACVGTAGLRGASNAKDFLEQARRACAIDIEIIDGTREAELAFRAPAMMYGPGPIVVVDVGGRSTEIATGRQGQIDARISFEIGSVRLTERFLAHDPPLDDELARLDAHLDETLLAAPETEKEAKLIGVSGTVLSLMGVQLGLDAMEAAVRLGEGRPLMVASVLAAYEDLRRKPAKARIRGSVIPPGRADVIVAGARIVAAVIERYGAEAMIASNRGVRYGVLYELASRCAERGKMP